MSTLLVSKDSLIINLIRILSARKSIVTLFSNELRYCVVGVPVGFVRGHGLKRDILRTVNLIILLLGQRLHICVPVNFVLGHVVKYSRHYGLIVPFSSGIFSAGGMQSSLVSSRLGIRIVR